MYSKYNKTRATLVTSGWKRIEGDYNDPTVDFTNLHSESELKKKLYKEEKYKDVNALRAANKYCIPVEVSQSPETIEMIKKKRPKVLAELTPWRMFQTLSPSSTFITTGGQIINMLQGITRGSSYNQYEGLGLKPFSVGFEIKVFRPAQTAVNEIINGYWRLLVLQLRTTNSSATTLSDIFTEFGEDSARPLGFLKFTARQNIRKLYDMPFAIGLCRGQFSDLGQVTSNKSANQRLCINVNGSNLDKIEFDAVGSITKGGLIAVIIGDNSTATAYTPEFRFSTFTRYRTN